MFGSCHCICNRTFVLDHCALEKGQVRAIYDRYNNGATEEKDWLHPERRLTLDKSH